MVKRETDSTRIGRKRPRLSESETRARALSTAVEALMDTGLSVGLDRINMEDVIREAGVSRTAVYRLWPQKDQFIGDLILELAETAIPGTNTRGEEATELISGFLLPHLDELAEPASRWSLVSEMVGAAVSVDFEHTASLSTQWRTYFALVVTIMNLPDDELRVEAQRTLDAAESRYRQRLAENYRVVSELLGFRLADPERVGYDEVAHLMIAIVRGFVLQTRTLDSREDQNALLRIGVDALLTRSFEIDPEVMWDRAHVERLRAVLSPPTNLFPPADSAD